MPPTNTRDLRNRHLGFVAMLVFLALGVGACAAFGDRDTSLSVRSSATTEVVAASTTTETTTTVAPTTVTPTTVAPTTVPGPPGPPTTAVPVATDPHLGLLALGYRPTAADAGRVVALFQRNVGLEPNGEIDFWTHVAIDERRTPPLLVPDGEPTRIEVDLRAQRLVALVDGRVALVSYISSGASTTPTPRGDFRVYAHSVGYQPVQKGRTRVYEPLWYSGNYGIHGYHTVPTRAASSGCIRIPNWIADDLTALVNKGTPVHIR